MFYQLRTELELFPRINDRSINSIVYLFILEIFEMKNHSFEIILDVTSDYYDHVENILVELKSFDTTLSMMSGIISLHYDRECETFNGALFSAISELSENSLPIKMIRHTFHDS